MEKVLMIVIMGLIIWLPAAAAYGQGNPDTCEVFLVDQQAASKVFESITSSTTQEEAEERTKSAVRILGKFPREAGEEVLTNKTFPIPNSRLTVTASIMYTDEFLERMVLGIAVSREAKKSAFNDPDGAVVEVSYMSFPHNVRVKKYIKIRGKQYTVGLFCQFNIKSNP